MKDLKSYQIDISLIKPYDRNPRKNEDAIEAVAQSIEKFGFVQPIVVNQDNTICIGHTRYEAARLLKMTSVPCIVKHMSEQEFIALNLADNKTGEIADWDEDMLRELIVECESMDNIEIPGFDMSEIDLLLFGDEKKESKKSKNEDDDSDPNQMTKKLTYILPIKLALQIDSKLSAIKKENKLDTEADALVFALKSFKTETKVKRVRVHK